MAKDIDLSDLGAVADQKKDIDLSDLGAVNHQADIDLSDLGAHSNEAIHAALAPFINAYQSGVSGNLQAAANLGAQGAAALGEPIFEPTKQMLEQSGYNTASDVSQRLTQAGLPNSVAEAAGVISGIPAVATGTLMPSNVAQGMIDVVSGALPIGKAATVPEMLAEGEAASKAVQGIPTAFDSLATKVPAIATGEAATHAMQLSERESKILPSIQNATDEELDAMLKKVQLSKQAAAKDSSTIDTLLGGNMLKARTQLVDSYAPVEALFGKAQEITGRTISPEKNPYIAIRNYAGISGKIQNTYDQLSQILKPTQGLKSEISDYFTAQRDFERAVRGFKNPGGVTDSEALGAIESLRRKMDPVDFKNIEEATTRIRNEVTNPLIDRLLESGVINKEGAAALKAKNQMWAPFDVIEHIADNTENLAYGRKSFQVGTQDVIKSLKGTEKSIKDPMESLVSRIAKTEALAQRNEVAQKLAGLVDEIGTENVFVKHLKANELPARGYDKIAYFDNGIKKAISVPKAVADSVKGMNKEQADFITRGLGVFASILRGGATVYNLPFALMSNPIRDFQTAMLTSGKGPAFAMDMLKGLADVVGEGKAFQAFKAAGGDQGMLASLSQSGKALSDIRSAGSLAKTALTGGPMAAARQLSERTFWQHVGKTVTSPLDLIREVGTVVELTPRVGMFKLALAQGKSPSEAAFLARNATVDFSKSGDVLKVVNRIVPFLNARIQGSLNIFNKFKTNPLTSAAVISSTVMMPEVALYSWNNSPQRKAAYDDIPEYEKQNYFIMVKGWRQDDKTGQAVPDYIRIPRGDSGQYFGSPIRHFLDVLNKNDPMAVHRIALQMGSDMSPIGFASGGKLDMGPALGQALPPPFRAAVQGYTNKNLGTGLPIVPPDMQKATDLSQVYQQGKTPQTAIMISRWLNNKVSPIMVDSFIRTMAGGFVPYLAEPEVIKNQIANKFKGTASGAVAGKIYDAEKSLQGDVANMQLRFKHAIEDIYRDPKLAPMAIQRVTNEVKRAAIAGIDADMILNAFNSEVDSQAKGKSIDKRTAAFMRLSENEVQRYLGIKAGAFPKPLEYPNATP